MAGHSAKREEPMNLTGGQWEIPRQGPYNWRSKVATPGQYPGPADRERRKKKWKSNYVTHVFRKNPTVDVLRTAQMCWWKKSFTWAQNENKCLQKQEERWIYFFLNVRSSRHLATHCQLNVLALLLECTRSDFWLSLEGWNFCMKLRLLCAACFGCYMHESISQHGLFFSYCPRVIPGYSFISPFISKRNSKIWISSPSLRNSYFYSSHAYFT
jgi:hypothetical protein